MMEETPLQQVRRTSVGPEVISELTAANLALLEEQEDENSIVALLETAVVTERRDRRSLDGPLVTPYEMPRLQMHADLEVEEWEPPIQIVGACRRGFNGPGYIAWRRDSKWDHSDSETEGTGTEDDSLTSSSSSSSSESSVDMEEVCEEVFNAPPREEVIIRDMFGNVLRGGNSEMYRIMIAKREAERERRRREAELDMYSLSSELTDDNNPKDTKDFAKDDPRITTLLAGNHKQHGIGVFIKYSLLHAHLQQAPSYPNDHRLHQRPLVISQHALVKGLIDEWEKMSPGLRLWWDSFAPFRTCDDDHIVLIDLYDDEGKFFKTEEPLGFDSDDEDENGEKKEPRILTPEEEEQKKFDKEYYNEMTIEEIHDLDPDPVLPPTYFMTPKAHHKRFPYAINFRTIPYGTEINDAVYLP